MTPDALRVLALHAQITAEELTAKSRVAQTDGANHFALALEVCCTSFLTFARILAEAANSAEGE